MVNLVEGEIEMDNLNVARIVSRTLVVLGIVNLIFTLNLLNKNKN